MQDADLTQPTPQFDTAEYTNAPGTTQCAVCQKPLAGVSYRINGHPVCATCTDQFRTRAPQGSHAAFVRALAFGIPAAILGLIGYAAFEILTHLTIGYLALGVGYVVAKAMLFGSGGIGGRRYQIAAVILTYAAVSMAAIPVGLIEISKERQAHQTSAQNSSNDGQNDQQSSQPPKHTMTRAQAFAYLAFLGLASPFLDLQSPLSGLIGLVILYVGIQIAWKMTAGPPVPEITGPY
jgi:hypothetical protein